VNLRRRLERLERWERDAPAAPCPEHAPHPVAILVGDRPPPPWLVRDGGQPECRACGRAIGCTVIEFEVVPDRPVGGRV
jgi:hypothetical protein